jgi:uncharacterized membrane protein YagU involved in acid resistance
MIICLIGVLLFGVLYAAIVVGINNNRTGISLGAVSLILYMIQLPLFGLVPSTWNMPEPNFVMFLIMGLMVYLRPGNMIKRKRTQAKMCGKRQPMRLPDRNA